MIIPTLQLSTLRLLDTLSKMTYLVDGESGSEVRPPPHLVFFNIVYHHWSVNFAFSLVRLPPYISSG